MDTDRKRLSLEARRALARTISREVDTLAGEIEMPEGLLVLTADENSPTLRLTNMRPGESDRARTRVEQPLNPAAGDDAPLAFGRQYLD